MATLNLHGLMSDNRGYLRKLRVSQDDEQTLRRARETVRQTLRDAFKNWSSFIDRRELFDAALPAADARLPVPKFKMQGSFTYYTANDCQYPPDQQVDMDDGVYLPLTFVMINGRARPTVASDAYFKLVERALQPLCDRNGWKLSKPPKNTCVRIVISPRLHLDLPLYAIKDSEYEEMVEAAAQSQLRKAAELRDSIELDEQIYRTLADADIILAHRKSGWIASDPRRLERWFNRAIGLYGEQVRDLCRAFKGLRDARWSRSDLGSICIMAAVVDVLPQVGKLDTSRLDLSLMKVAGALAVRFTSPVDNPGFPGETDKRLCNEWTPTFRAEVQSLFQTARDQLSRAVNDTVHKGLAIGYVKEAFGSRVPNDPELITLVGAAEMVRQTAPFQHPQQIVPRTKSG